MIWDFLSDIHNSHLLKSLDIILSQVRENCSQQIDISKLLTEENKMTANEWGDEQRERKKFQYIFSHKEAWENCNEEM